jgi:hypothetical protein
MPNKIEDVTADIDRAMKKLRQSMKGIQIRTAGFKRDHDELACMVSHLTVTLADAQALAYAAHRRRTRRH